MPGRTEEILSDVIRLLRERAGLDSASFGVPGILYALDKRISASGTESPPDYLRRLSADAGEFQELLEELVVPETWFFREAQAFRYLTGYLDQWRSSRRGSIRVLSVACSTGEEVYSLAITLREAGFSASEARILGTDISRKALAAAREGTYSSRSYSGTGRGDPHAAATVGAEPWGNRGAYATSCVAASSSPTRTWRDRTSLRVKHHSTWCSAGTS